MQHKSLSVLMMVTLTGCLNPKHPKQAAPISTLIDEYHHNIAAGESKYTGKAVQLYGTAESVQKDAWGTFFMQFRSGGWSLKCMFSRNQKRRLAEVRPGDRVVLRCIVKSVEAWKQTVFAENCQLVGTNRVFHGSGRKPATTISRPSMVTITDPKPVGVVDLADNFLRSPIQFDRVCGSIRVLVSVDTSGIHRLSTGAGVAYKRTWFLPIVIWLPKKVMGELSWYRARTLPLLCECLGRQQTTIHLHRCQIALEQKEVRK